MRYAFLLLVLLSFPSFGQSLRDINYNFQYDPTEPFTFNMKSVRTTDGWEVFFSMTFQDSAQHSDQFLLQWELRNSLDEKQGAAIEAGSILKNVTKSEVSGSIKIKGNDAVQILTARVLNNVVKRVWFFYRTLPPNYPANGYVIANGRVALHPYVKSNTPLTLVGSGDNYIVSYYEDDFPAAVPAFSEGMGRVARSLKVDSTFNIAANSNISFSEKGLYLVQKDTSTKEGFAFRVESDYPRLAKVESLADPLVYICTKQEFFRVKEAKGDKKAFDRVIIAITGSADRAKEFIRNYYKRVEWANTFFTSYKEGWKTDRGMIYMLFGLPDELLKFNDREVWNFNTGVKISFTFVKSNTLFDPDNYVLVRDKKFQETWYDKVDLWRNARF